MKAVYPPPWRDATGLRDALRRGERKAWSVLCMLAMCHRLGRTRPEQHRLFLERHPAWIDVLAAEESTSDDWMRLIDDWISAQEVSEEYSHWLGLYPSFRRLWWVSRELYPLLQRAPEPHLSPDCIFRFRDNPALSGTGVHLPRFSRAFGERGRAWICRELVRLGVWDFQRSQRYYVPWRIMCQVLGVSDGAAGEEIAKELEMSLGDSLPFGRVFDLPFDIIRFDRNLRAELLEVEDEDDTAFADDDDLLEGREP